MVRAAALIIVLAFFASKVFDVTEAAVSLQVYAYLGQSIELRCTSNSSSKFSRIQHSLPNGTVETLLSNDYLNTKYLESEIRIDKVKNVYVIRIDPVVPHSAGVYSCEDDVSNQNRTHHAKNMTIHVIPTTKPILSKRKFAKLKAKAPSKDARQTRKTTTADYSEDSESSSNQNHYGPNLLILASIVLTYSYNLL